MPKTTATVALVLSGLFVVFCVTLYYFADLTPANAPRPDWVNAPLPQSAGVDGPDQIGQPSSLQAPLPETSADGTMATSRDVATDASRLSNAGAAYFVDGLASGPGRAMPDSASFFIDDTAATEKPSNE